MSWKQRNAEKNFDNHSKKHKGEEMILGVDLSCIALDGVLGDRLREEFPGIVLVRKGHPSMLQAFGTLKEIADRWCDFEKEFTDPSHLAAVQVVNLLEGVDWKSVKQLVVVFRSGEADVNHPLIDVLEEKLDFQGLVFRCLVKGPGGRPTWQEPL